MEIEQLSEKKILDLVKRYERSRTGQPLFIIDHQIIRSNYQRFKENFPRIQVYYAIKSNSEKDILRTLYELGSSFDVASIREFDKVKDLLDDLSGEQANEFIYDKVIFANTIKSRQILENTRPYVPLMTFDNPDELEKIKKYCDCAGVMLRVKVPDKGSMVEMAKKFGVDSEEGIKLIETAHQMGLIVEGLSFHVGSQCTDFSNYVDALNMARDIFKKVEKRGIKIGRRDNKHKILDIGGGFPTEYNTKVPQIEKLAEIINPQIDGLFPPDLYELAAEPGRFMVGNAATLILTIIGKSRRDGKRFYHVNDGLYHTASGILFDHCCYDFRCLEKDKNKGELEDCIIAGQTCDSFDTIPYKVQLPGDLDLEDILIMPNAGAYTTGSSSQFNGFPGARIININRER